MEYEQLRLLVEHSGYIFKGLINKQIFDGFEKSLKKVKRKKYLGVKTNIKCKKCEKQMRLKKGKYGFFLGCSGYSNSNCNSIK